MKAPTWVRPVSTVVMFIGIGGLTWSGATGAQIGAMVTIGTGAVAAISGLIAAVTGKNKED